MRKLTSLGLILNRVGDGAPEPPKPEGLPEGNGFKLMASIRKKAPTKMRKGRSGEIPRRR